VPLRWVSPEHHQKDAQSHLKSVRTDVRLASTIDGTPASRIYALGPHACARAQTEVGTLSNCFRWPGLVDGRPNLQMHVSTARLIATQDDKRLRSAAREAEAPRHTDWARARFRLPIPGAVRAGPYLLASKGGARSCLIESYLRENCLKRELQLVTRRTSPKRGWQIFEQNYTRIRCSKLQQPLEGC